MLLALLMHASVAAFSFHSCCIQPSMLSALFSKGQQKAPLITLPAELSAPNNHQERSNETTLQPTDASHIAAEDVDFPKMSIFCCCRRRNVEKAPPAHEVAHQKGNLHILFEKDYKTGEVREKVTGGLSLRHEVVRDAVKPYFRELSKHANKRTLQLVCANRITLQQVNQAILQHDKSEKLTIETLGPGLTKSFGHPWNPLAKLKVEKKMQLNANDIQSEVITTASHRLGKVVTKILDTYEVDGKKLNIYTDLEILEPIKPPGWINIPERAYEGHMNHQRKIFAAIDCE